MPHPQLHHLNSNKIHFVAAQQVWDSTQDHNTRQSHASPHYINLAKIKPFFDIIMLIALSSFARGQQCHYTLTSYLHQPNNNATTPQQIQENNTRWSRHTWIYPTLRLLPCLRSQPAQATTYTNISADLTFTHQQQAQTPQPWLPTQPYAQYKCSQLHSWCFTSWLLYHHQVCSKPIFILHTKHTMPTMLLFRRWISQCPHPQGISPCFTWPHTLHPHPNSTPTSLLPFIANTMLPQHPWCQAQHLPATPPSHFHCTKSPFAPNVHTYTPPKF